MENTEIMVANQNLYISPVVGIDEAPKIFVKNAAVFCHGKLRARKAMLDVGLDNL